MNTNSRRALPASNFDFNKYVSRDQKALANMEASNHSSKSR